MSHYDELLDTSRTLQHCELVWKDLDPLKPGAVAGTLQRPGPDPIDQDFVVKPVRFDQSSPTVRDGEGGLLEQEALLGTLKVNSTPVGLTNDGIEVGVGVVSEERQLEAVLAVQRPVAIGVAAPVLRKDRRDFRSKIDSLAAPRLNDDRRSCVKSLVVRGNLSDSEFPSFKYAGFDSRSDTRIVDRDGDF